MSALRDQLAETIDRVIKQHCLEVFRADPRTGCENCIVQLALFIDSSIQDLAEKLREELEGLDLDDELNEPVGNHIFRLPVPFDEDWYREAAAGEEDDPPAEKPEPLQPPEDGAPAGSGAPATGEPEGRWSTPPLADRVTAFLEGEDLSVYKAADVLGVAEATLSSLLCAGNLIKRSRDRIEKGLRKVGY